MNKIGKVNIENVVVNHTFHDAAVSPGDGVELIVGDKKTLTIEIYGFRERKRYCRACTPSFVKA